MTGIYTFSPRDVLISLSGLEIKDLAQGSFIEVSFNSPPFIPVSGIRGKHTRRASRDKSGRVLFRLQQTSPINDVLSHIAERDQVTYTGLLSLSITDTGGSTGVIFKNCYISSLPSLVFSGDSTTEREWMVSFEVTARYHVGGNKNPTLDFLSKLTEE